MLVLLDRDGVINQDLPQGVTRVAELELIDGSAEAIAALNAKGIKVAIVTNQSAVAKGLMDEEELILIHRHLRDQLEKVGAHIDAIYACTDHPDEPTYRRKPNPGMVEEALRDFKVEAANTPLVGDALRDLQAAAAVGCPRHLVLTGKGHNTQNELTQDVNPVAVHANLKEAIASILDACEVAA